MVCNYDGIGVLYMLLTDDLFYPHVQGDIRLVLSRTQSVGGSKNWSVGYVSMACDR